MSQTKSNSKHLINGFGIGLLFVAFAAVGYGVHLFQQEKIDRLQAANRALQQQVTNLQTTVTEQRQVIDGLTAANGSLTANLQLVCQQSQSRFSILLQQKIDDFIEHDFANRWQQICQSQQVAVNSSLGQ